jgi:hypothetical protein
LWNSIFGVPTNKKKLMWISFTFLFKLCEKLY